MKNDIDVMCNKLFVLEELTNETGKEFFKLIKIKEFNDQIIFYDDRNDETEIEFSFQGYTIKIAYLKFINDYSVCPVEYPESVSVLKEFLKYIKKELRKNKIKSVKNGN